MSRREMPPDNESVSHAHSGRAHDEKPSTQRGRTHETSPKDEFLDVSTSHIIGARRAGHGSSWMGVPPRIRRDVEKRGGNCITLGFTGPAVAARGGMLLETNYVFQHNGVGIMFVRHTTI